MQPVLPPLDERLAGVSLASSVKVAVKKFEFEGNHVFSDRQLAKVVASYTGREITSEELEEARVALTRHYVDAGYITSGALLPDQDPTGGVIKFQIVEGRLTDIELRGNFWYRGWWLRNQMRRAAGRPVNFNNLKVGLQLLRQNPTISRVNAELKPGVKPGESILDVAVKDEQPFRFGFEISNKRPPSVSEGLGELYLTSLNLSGHNDPIDLRWGLVKWTMDGDVEYAEFDNVSGSYEMPITPWDTTLQIYANRSDSSIIDETFAALGITSQSEEFGLALKQPLYKTLNNTVTASLSADRKHSETYLLGRPFTLSLGALDGESTTFATRFALEWVNRSQVHVLALRSQFSLGLYDFGATRADPSNVGGTTSGAGSVQGFDPEIPDSKFFAWLGQAQYVRRIFDTEPLRKKPETMGWNILRETLMVLRVNAQLSDEPLLSLEQFSVGGMQSVRGYRENQLLRDNGVFASAEVRIPIWMAKDKTPIVSLAPFFDFGAGWNVNKLDDNYQTIYSAGIGLLVNATKHAQMTLYWGHPFVDFHEQKVSLQDYGLHFTVSFNAF
jgi:hemolysin activation/secretion protein